MFKIPTIPYLTPILCGISLTVGLYGGYKLTANHYDAKANEAKEAVIEQLAKQAKIDRDTIILLQTNERTLQNAYIQLGRKSREVKVVAGKCDVTNDGVSLWNQSLLGETDVSKAPSGATGTGRTDSSRGSSGTDFASAFENKLLNDEKCAKMRKRLEALKEWDRETFSD